MGSDDVRGGSRVSSFMVLDWTPYQLVWLGLFSGLAVAQTLFYGAGWFTFTVFLSGSLCVLLAAKGHILNYVVGLYNCFAYAWVAHVNGLNGEVWLNLLFYTPMAVVGLLAWRRHVAGSRVRMRSLSPGRRIAVTMAAVVATVGLGFFLSRIEGQNTPYIDAATNVLSVAATILMTLRYREQWLSYIAVDVLSVVMWGFRMINGSPEGTMMTVMWSAYLVNAVYGWIVWSRGSRDDAGGGVAE